MLALNISTHFTCSRDTGLPTPYRRLGYWLIALGILVAHHLVFIDPAQASNTNFSECIAKLKSKAQTAGISTATVHQVLGKAKHIQRVIDLDRRQPEFTQTFANYFNKRVSADRIKRGQALLVKYRPLLEQIQRKTGVPPHYLLAFWGLETNYGGYLGSMSTPNSLATLACDARRNSYFTNELLNALRIIDAGDIPADRMFGSWAGAMGHMQFMPTTYLRYALDGDGDGRRDLWRSIHDALASAANFLQQLGWVSDLHWGQEVQLPLSFDYLLAGRNHSLSLVDWARHGVVTASGSALPPLEHKAALLVPAGHHGPAFLVSENFDIIMRWNYSEFYALSVGHLADRIAGAPALHRSPPADSLKITQKQVHQLQLDLTTLGIDVGEVDGVFGPATRNALSHFQKNTQRIADGYLDTELLAAIRKAAASHSQTHSVTDQDTSIDNSTNRH